MQLVQSSAPDLSGVFPDLHQRSASGICKWKSHPFPTPCIPSLHPSWKRVISFHPACLTCTVRKHLTEIRELVCLEQKIPNVLSCIPIFVLSEEEMVIPSPTFIL